MIRRLIGPVPVVVFCVLVMVMAFGLAATVSQPESSAKQYSLLLILNVLGALVLVGLIVGSLMRLVRQLRQQQPGARLTMRLVGMMALLVVIPLAVLYHFSVQFLSRGVDSWFDVKVEKAVDDALLLGRTTLAAIKQEALEGLEDDGQRFIGVIDQREVVSLLYELRDRHGYSELSLYSQSGRIIGSSSQAGSALIPERLSDLELSTASEGKASASLEPLEESSQRMRLVSPVFAQSLQAAPRILFALKPVPLRYARLTERVEQASTQYRQMVFSRGPFKFSLILALSVVSLVALLLAVWAAIYLAQRMMSPLAALSQGTRAVAAGDYSVRLPVTSNDEIGLLADSFNDMTQQVEDAQQAVQRSQQLAEDQRGYLEAVLAHLSSGVMSFDSDLRLLTHNAAASQLLDLDLESLHLKSFEELALASPQAEPLLTAIKEAEQSGSREWQQQVSLFGSRGRLTLIMRGTRISSGADIEAGTVVVFDDVTDLIQAQRDAAWGEVARRLAHEIKNPLTPIQLSAERIRHKVQDKLPAKEQKAVDRATRTIVAQVESMKSMVDAFSGYARPAQSRLRPTSINQLFVDVAELHRSDNQSLQFQFDFDPELPTILVDTNQLRQVAHNLFLNAADALAKRDDATVLVQTRLVDDHEPAMIEIRVSDNGSGFDHELIHNVFEPYVSTKQKGTGLGLAIVKRIIDEHGGMIWAENVKHGGACVCIQLPVQRVNKGSSSLTAINQAGGASH